MTKEEAMHYLECGATANCCCASNKRHGGDCEGEAAVIEAINIAIEALEQPEIIHAHWIRGQYDFETVPQMVDDKLTLGEAAHYHCSNCGCVLAHMRRNYCPDCGAKMDEET